ncbi:hypothetical protein [uncultured Coprobacter sp.]|jgi:hypothetical protein|uniref:hypothetical protein n=1 Tax=uncultured Coprobacter sp. TaxID=1720550 RepID=UPI0025D65685|nr:hypothetical protein [uncultured Coprobacter sp.]
MRRILSVAILLAISISLFAQKDVTKFMGIPIDGFKPEMIQKLKEKGFVSSASDKNILEGEFNGTQVNVHIVTNNNKVCRIMLCDVHQKDETDIKIRFNKLCQQFKNNSNYVSFSDYAIADDEDIAYELTVHDKRYEAIFYQKPLAIDSIEIADKLKESVLSKYTQQELDNPTEEIQKDIYKMSLDYAMEIILKKPVWFMISKFAGRYYITMFYDNEYNKANGEDL